MEEILGSIEGQETIILGEEISVDEIKRKIAELTNIPEINLKTAMDDLKKALKLNPSAANLLLPEEIGEMVKHLYKVTNTVVVTETAKKAVSSRATNAVLKDADLLKKAFDEL